MRDIRHIERAPRTVAVAAVLCVLLPAAAHASDIAPAPDNGLSAHDLATGETIWSNDDVELGNTSLRLGARGVLEVLDRVPNEPDERVWVDSADGSASDPPSNPMTVVASAPQGSAAIVLANGWTMDAFARGGDKKATFSSTAGEVEWTIDFGEYVHQIEVHGDMVYAAEGYLADDRIIDAWTAGESERTWSVDLNDLAELGDARGYNGMQLDVVGDLVIAQWQHHVFALAPSDGALRWHIDLEKSLGVDAWLDLWTKWGNPDATLAWDDEHLVFSWDRSAAVLRLSDQSWLWRLDTDASPHRPVPLVHDGVVYLMTGPKRALVK